MALEGRDDLQKLNPYLELNVNHIALGSFDYARTETFPVNILGLTLESDGRTSVMNMETGEKCVSKAGRAHFIPSGLRVRHEISAGTTFIALHFNLAFFNGVDVFSGVKKISVVRDPEMLARVRAALDEPDKLKAICALKSEVLNFCLRVWPEGRDLQAFERAKKHEPIFRHIRERGDAELTVEKLAALAGRRKDSFTRAFSRDVGKSPKSFLEDDLVKRIIARLLLPDVRLKQIADELKFSSEFYMSRFFKKRTGISPSEYQAKFRR